MRLHLSKCKIYHQKRVQGYRKAQECLRNCGERQEYKRLYGEHGSEQLWDGKLSTSFDWFISDDNYRAVANKMLKATLKELREKGML
jgi:hypothetical protein